MTEKVYVEGDDYKEGEFMLPTYGITEELPTYGVTEAYVGSDELPHSNKIEVYGDEELRNRIINKLNGHQMQGECSICGKHDACTHFDFYVTGSEGVWLCQNCQGHITEFLRTLHRVGAQVRKDTFKKMKRKENTHD